MSANLMKVEKSYKCQICSKVFSHTVGLNIHLRSHYNKKCCICNICNKIFSKQWQLSKHLLSHKGSSTLLTCDLCDKVFSHQIALNVHRQTHVRKKSLSCDASTSEEVVIMDIIDIEIENTDCSSMSDQPQYSEKNSDSAFFQNKESFDYDLIPEKPLELNAFQNNEESFECEVTQDVRKHLMLDVSQSRDIVYELLQESPTVNNTHNSTKSKKKPHLCNICKAEFSSQNALNNHSCKQGDKEKFACPKCDERFSQKILLYSHLHMHKRFTCKYCFKEFANREKYLYHINTHEKPFKCIVCEKEFAHRIHLEDHLRTHTDEKPFECEECLAKFSQRSHLNRHLHLHEEKGFTFKRK